MNLSPAKTVTLSTGNVGLLTLFTWSFGEKFKTEVPACDRCAGRIKRQRWFRILGTLMVAFGGAALTDIFFPDIPDAVESWAWFGGAMVCLIPYAIWEIFVPPTVDVTASEDGLCFEFASEVYAERFAAMNDSTVE